MTSRLLDLTGTPSDYPFPPPHNALSEPDGLLAVGGCLSVARLRQAYQHGIFPWFSRHEPILWWSPAQRAVIYPEQLHISRSLAKFARQKPYQITLNRNFPAVIQQCATIPRGPGNGVWVTAAMQTAYCALHQAGYAHSVEVWQGNRLVGGLYGVMVGSIFCGESMFSSAENASKLALLALRNYLTPLGLSLIDCQIENPHLTRLGAVSICRDQFLMLLAASRKSAGFAQETLTERDLTHLVIGNY